MLHSFWNWQIQINWTLRELPFVHQTESDRNEEWQWTKVTSRQTLKIVPVRTAFSTWTWMRSLTSLFNCEMFSLAINSEAVQLININAGISKIKNFPRTTSYLGLKQTESFGTREGDKQSGTRLGASGESIVEICFLSERKRKAEKSNGQGWRTKIPFSEECYKAPFRENAPTKGNTIYFGNFLTKHWA